jgi:hypothetical protein
MINLNAADPRQCKEFHPPIDCFAKHAKYVMMGGVPQAFQGPS